MAAWYQSDTAPICRSAPLGMHDEMFELYLVARGTSTAVVGDRIVALTAGDLLVVERGESHTFTASSDDYCHFVVQAPFVSGDKRSE